MSAPQGRRGPRWGSAFTLAMYGLLLLGCADLRAEGLRLVGCADACGHARFAEPLDCDASYNTDAPVGCLTGTLSCGDEVLGTTVGGESSWGDEFYASAFCFPAGDRHSGPERVYRLELPAYTQATISLQSDCEDLDLAAVAWAYDGRCPTPQHRVAECEGSVRRGDDEVHVETLNNARGYLVAVDGKAGVSAPFRLRVDCGELNAH